MNSLVRIFDDVIVETAALVEVPKTACTNVQWADLLVQNFTVKSPPKHIGFEGPPCPPLRVGNIEASGTSRMDYTALLLIRRISRPRRQRPLRQIAAEQPTSQRHQGGRNATEEGLGKTEPLTKSMKHII